MAWSVHSIGSSSTTLYMEKINSIKRLRNMGTPILRPRTEILAKFPSSSYQVCQLQNCVIVLVLKINLFTGLDKNILSCVLESASRYKAKSPEGFHLARSKYNRIQSYSLKYLKIFERDLTVYSKLPPTNPNHTVSKPLTVTFSFYFFMFEYVCLLV